MSQENLGKEKPPSVVYFIKTQSQKIRINIIKMPPISISFCCDSRGVFFWSDNMQNLDKCKDNGILLSDSKVIKLSKEVMLMAENDTEMLNSVYKEVSERLGIDVAMEIYKMFKGQQISFPVRFLNPERTKKAIIQEYDGDNIRTLAIKYGYSEKTIRRIIKRSLDD